MMRAQRAGRASAIDAAEWFAALPSVRGLGADLSLRGYALTPRARMFPRADGGRTVRLVWRHRELNASIVLTVRL